MIWLILGVALWAATHLFKRAAPEPRAAMGTRMGNGAKGVFAALIVLAVVSMAIGFRAAEFRNVYLPPAWGVHVNNLLMLVAVALFGLGHSKSRLRPYLRHPMLLAVIVWAVAHLLANGDLAAVVLFGGLGLWAVAEIVTINAREPAWEAWQGGSLAGDVRLAVIALVLYAVIAAIHAGLGVWPFAG